jgi:hypothetical protein
MRVGGGGILLSDEPYLCLGSPEGPTELASPISPSSLTTVSAV